MIITVFQMIVSLNRAVKLTGGIDSMAFATKTILAGVLGTGIVVSTIAWTGAEGIGNIKGNIDSLKKDAIEAMADNGFLKNELVSLQGLYTNSTEEANAKIVGLRATNSHLEDMIVDLQAQLDAKVDTSAEQAEMQQEIDRLVS